MNVGMTLMIELLLRCFVARRQGDSGIMNIMLYGKTATLIIHY